MSSDPNAAIMSSVSLGADATSTIVPMKVEWMVSIQAVWTGSPVGNFTIETSDDAGATLPDGYPNPASISNWTTYSGSSQAAGGGSGSFVWRITACPDRWVRLKYTRSSGTGSVSARFNAKGT